MYSIINFDRLARRARLEVPINLKRVIPTLILLNIATFQNDERMLSQHLSVVCEGVSLILTHYLIAR